MIKKFKKWLAIHVFYMYTYPDFEANFFLPFICLILGLIVILSYAIVNIK